MNKSELSSSSKQPRPPYRNQPPLSTGTARPPHPAAPLPKHRKIRVPRLARSAALADSLPRSNVPAGKPLRIVKALAWIILAVILAGATATGVAYVRLRSFQARLAEVDGWMAEGRDTAALDALRELAEPAVRHGLSMREIGTRTVRVLVRLGRTNDAEDAADALATLVPPDDAEPWTFASPQAVLSLPQWVAGDALYGAETMAWDRWAGYRELLESLCARDRLEMEKVRVLLAARHPNNPLCPGRPRPVIREGDNHSDQSIQASQTSPTGQTGQTGQTSPTPPPTGPTNLSHLALESDPTSRLATPPAPPPPAPVAVPATSTTPAPAVIASSAAHQESVRERSIRQLHDRLAAILSQLKILQAANDNAPAGSSAAQTRLAQHRAEMEKIAKKSESTTGVTRTRALEQLRQMKYREMQLQREADSSQAAPSRQVTTLRSELAGIEDQLQALDNEPVATQRP